VEATVTTEAWPSLVRIIQRSQFGSGLIISSTDILTAGHVVSGARGAELRIVGQAWGGAREPVAVSIHPDPAFDVALLHLDPTGAAPPSAIHSIPGLSAPLANVGDWVNVFGFSTIDRDLERTTTEITSIDGIANLYVLNSAVPAGFSGGIIVTDDRVAGLTIARNTDSQRSYAYPIGRLIPFLQQYTRGDVEFESTPTSPLRRYPLGPMVRSDVVIAECRRLIDFFIENFRGKDAIDAIGAANKERRDCGPPSGPKGLINFARLPDPFFANVLFWQEAFIEAGKKSPRMLAALMRVADEDLLNEEQRRDRAHLLRELETWNGR
jgi:hypothetical protein